MNNYLKDWANKRNLATNLMIPLQGNTKPLMSSLCLVVHCYNNNYYYLYSYSKYNDYFRSMSISSNTNFSSYLADVVDGITC